MEINSGDILINSIKSVYTSLILKYWPLVILIFVCYVLLYIFQQYRYRKSGINEVDRMTGEDFELFLVNLFQRLGYKVQHIGKLGDYGGDLIIEKNGIKTLVQAKRSKYKLREKAVQEAIAAKENYHCDKAMVVTNNYLWKHAWRLARNTGVELWTRDVLINKINDINTTTKN